MKLYVHQSTEKSPTYSFTNIQKILHQHAFFTNIFHQYHKIQIRILHGRTIRGSTVIYLQPLFKSYHGPSSESAHKVDGSSVACSCPKLVQKLWPCLLNSGHLLCQLDKIFRNDSVFNKISILDMFKANSIPAKHLITFGAALESNHLKPKIYKI